MNPMIRRMTSEDAAQDRAIDAPFCLAESPVSIMTVAPTVAEMGPVREAPAWQAAIAPGDAELRVESI